MKGRKWLVVCVAVVVVFTAITTTAVVTAMSETSSPGVTSLTGDAATTRDTVLSLARMNTNTTSATSATAITKKAAPKVSALVFAMPANPLSPFGDVHMNDWFYIDVLYVYANGLMTGISKDSTLFCPDMSLTWDMTVTILYGMAGRPDAYADAAAWAAANGILAGMGDGEYVPDAPITMQDLVAVLSRYAALMGLELPEIRDYAGFNDGKDFVTRAEAAAMLKMFQEAATQKES